MAEESIDNTVIRIFCLFNCLAKSIKPGSPYHPSVIIITLLNFAVDSVKQLAAPSNATRKSVPPLAFISLILYEIDINSFFGDKVIIIFDTVLKVVNAIWTLSLIESIILKRHSLASPNLLFPL